MCVCVPILLASLHAHLGFVERGLAMLLVINLFTEIHTDIIFFIAGNLRSSCIIVSSLLCESHTVV